MMNTNQETRGRLLAILVAVGVAAGAVWVTLVDYGVTLSEPPPFTTGTDAELEAWFAWAATTMPQWWLSRLLLALGLIGVGITALRAAARGNWPRGGAVTVLCAAALWALADLALAGGRQAGQLMAASDNPIQTVASIAFTLEVVNAWLQAGAAVTLAAGAAAMARSFLVEPRGRPLGICSVVVAVAALAFGGTMLAPDIDATIPGVALAVVLLPIWTVWLSREAPPRDVAARAGSGVAAPTDLLPDRR